MDSLTSLQAILLGFVEGLTEFIPVSSTGHLILLIDLIGFKGPPGKVFEIVIQLGAILAICWIYKGRLFQMVTNISSPVERRFAIQITLAFLPAACLGAIFHEEIKTLLFSPWVVSVNLILGGLLILWVEKHVRHAKYRSIEHLRFRTTFFIGLAQAISMIPGVSRSGATIMGAVMLGVDRKVATEFSFFLAIPTMFGATIYDLYQNMDYLDVSSMKLIVLGFVSAFFAGFMVVKTLIAFISTHGFTPFAWYRIALGLVMILCLLY